jgi:hypothetical protein
LKDNSNGPANSDLYFFETVICTTADFALIYFVTPEKAQKDPKPIVIPSTSVVSALSVDHYYLILGYVNGITCVHRRCDGQHLLTLDPQISEQKEKEKEKEKEKDKGNDSLVKTMGQSGSSGIYRGGFGRGSALLPEMKRKVNRVKRWGDYIFCATADMNFYVWSRVTPSVEGSALRPVKIFRLKEEVQSVLLDSHFGRVMLVMRPPRRKLTDHKKDDMTLVFRTLKPKLESFGGDSPRVTIDFSNSLL